MSGPRHDRPIAARQTARRAWRAGRLRSLRRAVEVFGFHLASLDLRQNSDVHERVVAELFASAGVARTTRHWTRRRGRRCSLASWATPRPLRSPFQSLWRRTAERTRDPAARRTRTRRYGRAAVPTYVISKTTACPTCSRSAVLLQEVGTAAPARRPHLDVNIAPLFETIDDLQRCGRDHGRAVSACPPIARLVACATARRRSCSATPTATRTAAT